jgi:hypothetical protein
MQITKTTLRRIIKEELDAAMSEQDMKIGSMEGDLDPEFTRRLNVGSEMKRKIEDALGVDVDKIFRDRPRTRSAFDAELGRLGLMVADGDLEFKEAVSKARDMIESQSKAPMEEVIKKGELDRNQLRAQRQIHAAIQNMHKRNPKRARRIIDYLEREVPPKYMNAIKNAAQGNVRAVDAARALLDLAKSAVPPKRSMEEADVQLNTYSGDLESMEEAAHEPAGELVHRANPNFRVFKTVKGAGPTYGGVKGGYRSKTLSKVGEFELYRGDERLGVFTSLPAAKKRIAALSARRR